jgi:hypothetical protein
VKHFAVYALKWISNNLAIPFWMVGHIHLTTNVYEDVYEVMTSIGLNAIVLAGFIYEYYESRQAK